LQKSEWLPRCSGWAETEAAPDDEANGQREGLARTNCRRMCAFL
jgi:hypothetical protein